MIKLIYAACLLLNAPAFAGEVGIPENVSYIVTAIEGLNQRQIQACFRQTCRISVEDGGAQCQVIATEFSIFKAVLTDVGADRVRHLRCVAAVEIDGAVGAQPRIGRGN